MLSPETKRQIGQLPLMILILPESGIEGTDSEEHIRYAMECKKHIILWRPPGRVNIPVPEFLSDYDDYRILDGSEKDVADAVCQFFELIPGSDTKLKIAFQEFSQK